VPNVLSLSPTRIHWVGLKGFGFIDYSARWSNIYSSNNERAIASGGFDFCLIKPLRSNILRTDAIGIVFILSFRDTVCLRVAAAERIGTAIFLSTKRRVFLTPP